MIEVVQTGNEGKHKGYIVGIHVYKELFQYRKRLATHVGKYIRLEFSVKYIRKPPKDL